MLLFLIKASFIIGTTWLFYKVFLQKESFFALNRLFLLTSLFLAFLIPFLNLPRLIDHQGLFNDFLALLGLLDEASMTMEALSSQFLGTTEMIYADPADLGTSPLVDQTSFNWFTIIVATYLLGVLALGAHFLFQLKSLFAYIQQSQDKHYESGAVIIHADMNLAPCSFFKYIFIDPLNYTKGTYEQILAHEKIHAQYGHSYDLILAKLATIILWFNPFVWFFKRDIEKNIEYQTDHLLLAEETYSMEAYQMSLLQVAHPHKDIGLTTNYNQSLLTQRIIMMKSKKSTLFKLWKYVFLFPLFLGMLLILNDPIKLNAQIQEFHTVPTSELSKSYERLYLVIDADTQVELIERIKISLKKYDIDLVIDDLKVVDGKIFSANVKMDYPGVRMASAGWTDSGIPLRSSIIHYDEMNYKGGSSGASAGGFPDHISEYGEEIVRHNLNGLLIIDDKGEMHMIGTVELP